MLLSSAESLAAKIRRQESLKEAKEHLALTNAVKGCKFEEVKRLLEFKADVNEKDHRGSTPLIHAVWCVGNRGTS